MPTRRIHYMLNAHVMQTACGRGVEFVSPLRTSPAVTAITCAACLRAMGI